MKPRLKRALKIVGGVLLLLVVLAAIPIVGAFWGTSDIHDGKELSPALRVVKDGYTSASVLDVGGGKVALIDAGNDAAGKALLAELTPSALPPRDRYRDLFVFLRITVAWTYLDLLLDPEDCLDDYRRELLLVG